MEQNLVEKVNSLEKSLIEKKSLFNQYDSIVKDNEKKLKDIDDEYNINNKSSELLIKFSSDMRDVIGKEIERLVTEVLQKTFSDRYTFKINFVQRRGVVEADFYLHDVKYDRDIDIIESSGGTVADEVSAVLFFVLSEMVSSGKNYIVFDEIGKHISPDKRESFFNFIKELINLYDKQIIYVTHQDELVDIADKVVELKLDEDEHVVCNERN